MRRYAASRLLLRPVLAGGGGRRRLPPHPPPPPTLSRLYSTAPSPRPPSPLACLGRPASCVSSGTRSISNPLRYWSARKLGVSNLCSGYSTRTSNFKSKYSGHSKNMPDQEGIQLESNSIMLSQQDNQAVDHHRRGATGLAHNQRVGQNISAVDKRKFLINTLFDLKDSKEAVYDTLDAWVAWERNFPLVSLKRALLTLEKEHQWHRIVQVLKWMLSKGQGTTVGTYEQLIRALEKDNRPEEAHKIWVKKISHDLHSVPWRVCDLMISIYYRNNMLERLVKLFKGLESYDRIPPTKSIVQKVADAYEMLGLLEEKSRVMEKYKDIFNKPPEGHFKKRRKSSRKNGKEADKKNPGRIEASDNCQLDPGSSDGETDDSLKR